MKNLALGLSFGIIAMFSITSCNKEAESKKLPTSSITAASTLSSSWTPCYVKRYGYVVHNHKVDLPDLQRDTTTLYLFRDNFLSLTDKGRKYTDYYYTLSDYVIYHDLITVDNISDSYTLLSYGIQVADALNQTGNDDQVIVTEDMYAFTKGLSDKVKSDYNVDSVR